MLRPFRLCQGATGERTCIVQARSARSSHSRFSLHLRSRNRPRPTSRSRRRSRACRNRRRPHPSRRPLPSRRHPSRRCHARLRGTALSISANIGLRMRVTGPCTGTTQPDIRRCGVTTTSPDIGITATWPRIGITRSGINTGRHIATGGTAGPSRARAPSLRRPASPSARESAAAGSTAASRLRAALHGTA